LELGSELAAGEYLLQIIVKAKIGGKDVTAEQIVPFDLID
jgi:hypothetical protein